MKANVKIALDNSPGRCGCFKRVAASNSGLSSVPDKGVQRLVEATLYRFFRELFQSGDLRDSLSEVVRPKDRGAMLGAERVESFRDCHHDWPNA